VFSAIGRGSIYGILSLAAFGRKHCSIYILIVRAGKRLLKKHENPVLCKVYVGELYMVGESYGAFRQ